MTGVQTCALPICLASERIGGATPAARFALETALVDLAAQAIGCSVAELLARDLTGEPAGEPAHQLACSAVVPPTGAGPEVPAAITTWKVKIGELDRLEQDLADLRRIPRGVHLRLDVNRRWSRAECEQHLPRLAELGPDWVEEPTTAADLVALGAGSPVVLALDESLVDEVDASRLALERGLVRVLVLKPALLGGLAAARAWAERARAAGAVPVVSHLFDGPIALAACAELALALARPGDPAAGLGPHRGLAAVPGARIAQLVAGGASLASHRPGLGIDEAAVLAACAPHGAPRPPR